MSPPDAEPSETAAPARTIQALVLVAGLILTQFILYGPALLGRTVLLPLDVLSAPGVYLPPGSDAGAGAGGRANWLLSDSVLQTELDRVFVAGEVRAGRLPMWNPYNYCGSPFLANNNAAVFSPFMIPSYLVPGPVAIAWTVLFRALVAGAGAYLFFRVTLRLRWWSSLVGAWCFPLTGYIVMLSWIHHSSVVSLLPWMLIAVDAAVRRPAGPGGPGLALATALVLLSGKLDTSAQVLLASGIYAIYCLIDEKLTQGLPSRRVLPAALVLVAGWSIGFGLSAPVAIPTADYLQTSARVQSQTGGKFDFPGQGIAGLPQVVLPAVHGTKLHEYVGGNGNIIESSASSYAGLITALFLLPLAWTNRRRRSLNIFLFAAFLFAAAPILNIPVVEKFYEIPPLHLLHNNRFSFFSAFCLLTLGVLGLNVLEASRIRMRWWLPVFALVLLVAAGWWGYRAFNLPGILTANLGDAALDNFRSTYLRGAALSILALGLFALCRFAPGRLAASHRFVGGLLFAEMIVTAHGFLPQSDPALYYPRLPALQAIQNAGPGRICGFGCLVPNLNRSHGLPDIRGYDGLDPQPIVRLLEIASPAWKKSVNYAITHDFVPVESPILRMLNLRYRVLWGTPPPGQAFLVSAGGFWVHDDPAALPRPYVPRTIIQVPDAETALAEISKPSFDPAAVAYVESNGTLPANGDIEGRATITHEVPGNLEIKFAMATPGLIVLSDLWYEGWTAKVNGAETEVLRVNSALQGVQVPAGNGTLEMRYRPAAFTRGIIIGGISLVLLGLWTVLTKSRLGSKGLPAQHGPVRD